MAYDTTTPVPNSERPTDNVVHYKLENQIVPFLNGFAMERVRKLPDVFDDLKPKEIVICTAIVVRMANELNRSPLADAVDGDNPPDADNLLSFKDVDSRNKEDSDPKGKDSISRQRDKKRRSTRSKPANSLPKPTKSAPYRSQST